MAEKKTVAIDGKEYLLENLSEDAKAQLTNLRAVDQELARLQMQQAIAKTARNAYVQKLQKELVKAEPQQ